MRIHISSVLVLLALLGVASAQVTQVKLAYALDSLEPNIDAKTMTLHYGTHYKAYVDNLNAATAKAGAAAKGSDLAALVQKVGTLDGDLFTAVRNQGGGAWNHALYFKHLAPTTSPQADPSKSVSKELSAAVDSSFGGFDQMVAEVKTAAGKVFGSGWAWVCYTGEKLVVTTTPNQDNPLMGNLRGAPQVKSAGCTPILGLDVWEHAYYIKHGPKRAAYLDDFFKVVNWAQVSQNFAAAKAGKVSALVA